MEGAGSQNAINGRIKQIKDEIAATTSDYDREKLQERLAKLTGGVAEVNVGAASEAEMKEKKARIEDALHATRAAIEEGIVPGGGVALIRCIDAARSVKLSGDEKTGAEILAKALRTPCYWIAQNAGATAHLVVNKVYEGKGAFGYNADTDKYEDLVEAGVIDPAKVVRTALQNAVSIAGLLLTTDCLVTEKPKKKEEMGPGGPGGGQRRHGRHGHDVSRRGGRQEDTCSWSSYDQEGRQAVDGDRGHGREPADRAVHPRQLHRGDAGQRDQGPSP